MDTASLWVQSKCFTILLERNLFFAIFPTGRECLFLWTSGKHIQTLMFLQEAFIYEGHAGELVANRIQPSYHKRTHTQKRKSWHVIVYSCFVKEDISCHRQHAALGLWVRPSCQSSQLSLLVLRNHNCFLIPLGIPLYHSGLWAIIHPRKFLSPWLGKISWNIYPCLFVFACLVLFFLMPS